MGNLQGHSSIQSSGQGTQEDMGTVKLGSGGGGQNQG